MPRKSPHNENSIAIRDLADMGKLIGGVSYDWREVSKHQGR